MLFYFKKVQLKIKNSSLGLLEKIISIRAILRMLNFLIIPFIQIELNMFNSLVTNYISTLFLVFLSVLAYDILGKKINIRDRSSFIYDWINKMLNKNKWFSWIIVLLLEPFLGFIIIRTIKGSFKAVVILMSFSLATTFLWIYVFHISTLPDILREFFKGLS